MSNAIAVEVITTKILGIRGRKVMLDRDLAKLYGVEVKALNQAVKRNIKRFPEDFMFQLSWEDAESLRSQIVTLNSVKIKTSQRGRHIKYLPYVFTEQGVAMLSSVLNSERAIQVNILIMRAFTKIREILLTHKELAAIGRYYYKMVIGKRVDGMSQALRQAFQVLSVILAAQAKDKKEMRQLH